MENVVQTPSHYVWEVEGKPVSIHLDFGVVDRIAMDVMRGFGAVPKRGAEVGGVMLGTFDKLDGKTVVKVEDFEPVVCDYLRGPSYLLTEKDEKRFAEAMARLETKDLTPVGFYRSHTRDGLGLADEDLALFSKYFGDSRQVILLVRPFATKTSMAGFFFEEGDSFYREKSYQEFPFRRKDLGGGNTPPIRSAPAEAPSVATIPAEDGEPNLREWVKAQRIEVAKEAAPVPPEPSLFGLRNENSTAKFRSRWVWIPLSLVFLIVGVVAGFQGAMMLNRQDVDRALARSVSLGLSTGWENGRIAVRWDRDSAPIQNAQIGSLRILDGEYSKVVTLDERQLRNGIVLYMSSDNRVSFRLEVQTRQRTQVTETVDYVPGRR
jgi:hypothetical protein